MSVVSIEAIGHAGGGSEVAVSQSEAVVRPEFRLSLFTVFHRKVGTGWERVGFMWPSY